MADGWTCAICNTRLSTGSNSAHSVAFDLEIISHAKGHECTCAGDGEKCLRCRLMVQ